MTESSESEQLAYLKGRWSVEDVRGFLDTPSEASILVIGTLSLSGCSSCR